MIFRASLCLVLTCIFGRTQSQECTAELDLLFLVDESGSICDFDTSFDRNDPSAGCDNFDLVKTFMNEAAQRLPVGPNGVHVGLVTFSDGALLRWDLCGNPTESELSSAILGLTYRGGNTHTGVGCSTAAMDVMCPGCCGNRPGVRDVVIVITDGNPTVGRNWEPPCLALQSQDDMLMYAVGIGNVDASNLAKLSSEPKQEDVTFFTSTDFSDLAGILDSLIQVACATPAPLPPPDVGCSTSIIDLMFIIDQSGSICDNTPSNDRVNKKCDNFDLIKEFMGSAVDRLTIGPNNARVSFVTFSSRVNSQIDFCQITDGPQATSAITGILHEGGTTFTEEACARANEQFCATSPGLAPCCDRPGVRDVVIILTDGVPTNRDLYKVPCGVLQNDKTVITVGIGNVNETILKDLSSEPKELNRNYFTTPRFEDLAGILDSLLAVACEVPEVDCRRPADVAFIMDVSGSIGANNFLVMKNAMIKMVDELAVNRSEGVLAAIISFSTNARVECHLSQSSDIFSCIQQLQWNSQGSTNTAAALDMAVDMVFTGANGDRADVDNICVIFTDGGSNAKEQTVQSAIQAKKAMTIYVVGVGNWLDEYELMSIASDPHSLHYRNVASFSELATSAFLNSLRTFVCNNEDNCNPNPCQNGGECVDKPGRYECVCPANYGGPECQYFCRTPCYLSIAIDSSGSIGKDNFHLVMEFAKDLVRDLPVGNGMSVSMLTYDTGITKYFDLPEYTTMEGTLNGMSIPYFKGGTTDTAGALDFMRNNMYSSVNVPDSEKARCGLVVTDGRSNAPLRTWAEAIATRNADIFLSAVGVGSNIIEEELRAIVSDPTEQNSYSVMRYENLGNIKDALRRSLCNADNECNPNPCLNGGLCRDEVNGFTCSCPPSFTGFTCERSCAGQMDLLLIIDRSGSIRRERFIDVQRAIARYLKSLEISSSKVRVAAVSFNDNARIDFYFDTYTKSQDIIEAIYKLQWSGGRTNIADALETGCEQVFGFRGDRADVYDHVLVFSDGGANIRTDETTPMAIQCKVSGKQMTVAAVGQDLNMLELDGIASEPVERNVATVPSFTNIMDLVAPMVAMTCNDIDDCSPNPCQNGGTCIDGMWSYQCVCSGNTGMNCERGPCNPSMDVVFILDISGSVEEVCVLGMSIIRDVLYGLNFQFGSARVALITYSDNAAVSFYLDEYSSQTEYLMAVVCNRRGGRTNTAAALDLAYDSVLVPERGDRAGVLNRVVLLTDGRSNINRPDTVSNANLLKTKADICVFGIGDQVDMNEINAIGAPRFGFDPSCVHRVRNMFEATTQANSFLTNICS